MGKDSGDSDVGKKTEQMAKQYFNETQGLREGLIGNYEGFLTGGMSPENNPQWASINDQIEAAKRDLTRYYGYHHIGPETRRAIKDRNETIARLRKEQEALPTTSSTAYDVTRNPVWGASRGLLEDQYDIAKENTISQMPEGGQMFDTLADVEGGRAQALGSLGAGIAQDEYNKLYGMATGAPATAMGTMSNLAGQQAMINAQESAAKAGGMGDLAGAAGMLGYGAMMKPPSDIRLKKDIEYC